IPAGPFRWASKPEVVLKSWSASESGGYIDALCHYANYSHRRRVLLQKDRLLVLDEMDGPIGDHLCEQNWQLGNAASNMHFAFSTRAEHHQSKVSPAYG